MKQQSVLKQFVSRLKWRAYQLNYGRLEDRIFFMHVPKCGGTSIHNALRNHYIGLDPAADRALFHLDPFAAHQAAIIAGQDPLAYARQLSLYFLGSQDYRYIAGHFSFSEAAYCAYQTQFAFITILREPVAKWFSLYFYNRYKKGDFFRIEADLEEFVDSPTAIGYGCDYVMQFAGDHVPTSVATDYYTTAAAIDTATNNLNKFHLVGCLEQLDTFVQEFHHRFGVQLHIPTQNRNPLTKQKQQQHISDEVMAKVQALCQPNTAVYHYAVQNLLNKNQPK